MFDVIIIGGSYAGLAAALQLGRARRDVLVIDAGKRRNRFVHASHGFLGSDGVSPDAIHAKAKADVLAYSTVDWREATVTEARKDGDGFLVRAGDEEHRARKVLLATGVVDDLPNVPGVAERWGNGVFHCPYCDGYELGQRPVGVISGGELSIHQSMLVSEWGARGENVFFLEDTFEPTPEQLAELERRGIRLVRERIDRVTDVEGGGAGVQVQVHLRDGTKLSFAGLFVAPKMRLVGGFAEQLGCAIETSPMGAFYKTDPMTKETTVPGVFACGDAGLMQGTVSFAVADGARAGIGIHRSLVFPPSL